MLLIKNIIHNSIFKRFIILLFLLLLFVTISAFSYANVVFQDFHENIFRLHVIANSDSEEDQMLKYIVRDNIIEYVSELSKDINSKNEVITLVNQNIDEIKKIAQETVSQHGYDYDITVQTGTFAFPTKQYGDISLPAGEYDALRIEIGKASRTKLVVCNVSSSLLCRCKLWHRSGIF